MEKRQSASSRHVPPAAKKAAKLLIPTLTDAELAAMTDQQLNANGYVSMTQEESVAHAKTPQFRARTKRLAAVRDEDIDYSEIPPISDARLAAMVRADQYRPIKRTITTRIDADVLEWLQTKSGGSGYQTHLNSILRNLMLRDPKS